MGVPLYVICHFSCVAFSILSLSLIFVSLIIMCPGVFLLGFILFGTLCASRTWLTISFAMFRKFLAITSSNIFSPPFSLSSPSGTPIMQMFTQLTFSKRSLRGLHFFSFFFLYSVLRQGFPPFCLPGHLIHSSASVILLLIPSNVLFISVCLFFNPSRSLVNFYCIFSIFAFILYTRF